MPIARNTVDAKKKRFDYAVKFSEICASNAKVLFIDETGISVHCRTNCRRSRIASPAYYQVRAVNGKNFSVCAAMDRESLYFH